MEQRKILGIIGGLGPMASAQFLELLTAMTDAAADQDHIETILYSKPQTPDRTAFLLRNSTENPLPDLIDSGKKLERLGAQVLAIPCMTAYGFYDALADAFQAKLIHPILKTAELLKKRKEESRAKWIFPNFIKTEEPINPALAYSTLKRILKKDYVFINGKDLIMLIQCPILRILWLQMRM